MTDPTARDLVRALYRKPWDEAVALALCDRLEEVGHDLAMYCRQNLPGWVAAMKHQSRKGRMKSVPRLRWKLECWFGTQGGYILGKLKSELPF